MTEMYLGKREQIAMCEEDSWASLGTKTMADDGFIVGKNVVFTPDFDPNLQEVLTAGADSRDVASLEKGPLSYKFTLSFNPTNWKFLRYCKHGSVTNTDQTTYYQHTFTKTDAVKSFTLERAQRGTVNEVLTLTGCVITNLVINFANGTGATDGFITVTAECLAKSLSKGTSITSVSAETDQAFQFRMAKWTHNGDEIVELNNGELTIDNGVDENDSRYCNATLDQEIGEPIPKTSRHTCRFNINLKDSTFTDDWIAQVAVPGTNKLEFIRGTNDDVVFTFTDEYLNSAISSTNIDGINVADVAGTVLSLSIVAKDQHDDY